MQYILNSLSKEDSHEFIRSNSKVCNDLGNNCYGWYNYILFKISLVSVKYEL